jgi:hypothetical protein
MFVGKDSFSFKPIVDVAPVISFYGNGTSTFQAGISTEALLTYSVPVTDDGRASGDLAKKGKSDFKLYLPAVASLFFAYRFGEAHESEVKLEVGLNDNDPRMTSGSYGRSQLASLIKYYGLNTGDVGFRVSARYQFIPDLAVYGRASYNPVADLSTDVTEKEAFHNSNQQSADVVVGIEYNGIENDSSPVSAFAQVQYMPEKIKDVGEWASNVGVAAGLKVKAADWLTIAAMGNYYMLDPNFAGFDSSWGAMGHLDFLVDKKSGLHIIPYGGYASATSPVTLGSSGTLTEGDRDAMYARNVAEAGVGFNFLKYFTIRAGWLRALIGTGNDYTNMGILGFTYIRK